MKKALKALMTLGGAALAVVGGVFVYRRFFANEEEPEEDFDDEELFEEEDADEIDAFVEEEEIFEEEESADPASEKEDTAKSPDAEESASGEKAAFLPVSFNTILAISCLFLSLFGSCNISDVICSTTPYVFIVKKPITTKAINITIPHFFSSLLMWYTPPIPLCI